MPTNRTRVYSPADFIERQSTGVAMPITMIGVTKDGGDKDGISFALDLDRDRWFSIPLELIENIEVLGTIKDNDQSYPKVSLQLKEPQSAEGRVLALLAVTLDQTLKSVARKVVPALGTSGSSMDVRDACHSCIEACSHIVVTEDDPFAGILCMLRCPCPG